MSSALTLHKSPDRANRAEIVSAIGREKVSRIRNVLISTVEKIDESRQTVRLHDVEGGSHRDLERLLADFSGIIEHELSSAIGWIDYVARREMRTTNSYEGSETATAVNVLKKRVLGLVALATVQRSPIYARESISEILLQSLPPQFPRSLLAMDAPVEQDFIDTDGGLLSLIVVNALNNAHEAASEADPNANAIFVSYGMTDSKFWITITNPYVGSPFSLGEVEATGYTTKADSRGLGAHIMQLAAGRLAYELRLEGSGGVATFSLRGSRSHSG